MKSNGMVDCLWSPNNQQNNSGKISDPLMDSVIGQICTGHGEGGSVVRKYKYNDYRRG